MEIQTETFCTKGIRAVITEGGVEVAWAFLYLIFNEQHKEPYGLIEDVFVLETKRGTGCGRALMEKITAEARANQCYKLIACSRRGRERVHALYRDLGFADHGIEFRMDLT